MKPSNSEALRPGSIHEQTNSSFVDEIDLYNELIAFAALPDEQRRKEQAPVERRPEGKVNRVGLEPVRTTAPIEREASALLNEESEPTVEITLATPESFPGYSSSLASLSPQTPFRGAITRGVCLACGAESGANDLFCIACGAFVDEVEPTAPSLPSCVQCGFGISLGEIFCPQCGSVLPVS